MSTVFLIGSVGGRHSHYPVRHLGVRPRAVMEQIEGMVEAGAAEYLIIGNKPVGKNPFRLTALSEAWNTIYSRGELAKAIVTITLEEYT